MVSKGAIGAVVGLVLLVALLVSGCGSGGGDETATKEDFVRKANAVCGKWQQERGEAFREANAKFKPPVTQAKQEKAVLLVLEPYGKAVQSLDELTPPEGEEEKVEEIVAAMGDAYEQAKANPGTLISSNAPFKKANELAKDYGLKECQG
jgi:hypothetical protein